MPKTEINGVSLYYNVAGEGTPIFFIHPPMLSSMNFKYQVEELSQNFQVITFDIRGHGKSEPSDEPLTYPLIAADIRGLMDHLSIEKAYLCGYSTGGSIVLEFLLSYPEWAWGAILVGGISEVMDMRLRNMISLGVGVAKIKARRLLAWSISRSNSDNKQLFQEMFHEALQGDIENIEQYYRYSLAYNCTDQLSQIEAPVLLVYGGRNKEFHSYGNLLHERLPHSELKFISDAKHQIPTKWAIQLNDFIRQFIYLNKGEEKASELDRVVEEVLVRE